MTPPIAMTSPRIIATDRVGMGRRAVAAIAPPGGRPESSRVDRRANSGPVTTSGILVAGGLADWRTGGEADWRAHARPAIDGSEASTTVDRKPVRTGGGTPRLVNG